MVAVNRVAQNTLGQSAHKVRLDLGLSQQQVADMAGISMESVFQYEHGLPVYLDARRKILKALWAAKAFRQNSRN
jgi:transcriptional regulator with XRE-family HTH domain